MSWRSRQMFGGAGVKGIDGATLGILFLIGAFVIALALGAAVVQWEGGL